MKIYVIGSPGSGKTTLAKKLAKKYHTKSYELDCIVYDDEDNHRKRTDKEIKDLFDEILKKKSWIIEDVGRSKFEKGFKEADQIYYLDFPKRVIYFRILKRWIKQKMGKETWNYPPTFEQLKDTYHTVSSYYRKEKEKKLRIQKYENKVTIINKRGLKNI